MRQCYLVLDSRDALYDDATKAAAPRPASLVCDSARVARHVAGDTWDRATVYQAYSFGRSNAGRVLLLVRWQGLDVDYARSVRPVRLGDGVSTGFARQGTAPWGRLAGAVWWSSKKMPRWLYERKVVLTSELPLASEQTAAMVREDEAKSMGRTIGGVRAFGYRAMLPMIEAARSSLASRVAYFPGFETAEV